MAGALTLTASGQGLTLSGIAWLLGGYATGAIGGYLLIAALGRVFGKWWDE